MAWSEVGGRGLSKLCVNRQERSGGVRRFGVGSDCHLVWSRAVRFGSSFGHGKMCHNRKRPDGGQAGSVRHKKRLGSEGVRHGD